MSYTNVNSHNFRDTSGYEPQKQTRVKCKLCGCWAKKGAACYQCHRLPDGTLVKPVHSTVSAPAEQGGETQAEETAQSTDWMYDQVDTPPESKEHVAEDEEPPEAGALSESGVGKRKDTPTRYTNATNHNFRETSPFEPQKQVREKCKLCGCWAKKGCACYQCHRFADGTLGKVPPRKPRIHTVPAQQGVEAARAQANAARAHRPHPARAKSTPDNVLQYQFRAPAPYDVGCKQRQKCPGCGCWVAKGKLCALCKRVTT